MTVSRFHDRLAELAPSLIPGDEQYQAGLLLLALTELPARIDHLAGALAIPREFVARCIRRLVDNGVLQNGALVCGWKDGNTEAEAFRADVKVALGSWCRRQNARGNLEWIEAGGWRKPFEYLSDPVEERCRTSYIAVESSRPRLNLGGMLCAPASAEAMWIGSGLPGLAAGAGSDDRFPGGAKRSDSALRRAMASRAPLPTWPDPGVVAPEPVGADQVVWLS